MERHHAISPLSIAAVLLVAGASSWGIAPAKVYLTQEQALALAFPGSAPERHTAYLTAEQEARAREMAGTAPASRIAVYYTGGPDPAHPLAAFFDTHLVRTLPETVMILVDGAGKVGRVEILSFDEPVDYLPARRWLDQFDGKPLSAQMETNKEIRAVSGATLSSKAITAAVRRALALHAILVAGPKADSGKERER